MPLFPYLQILGIILLAAILITMGLDTDFWNISWIVGIPWMIAISIAYAIWKRLQKARSTTAEYLGSE
jgi:L-asparagine transporter-like permease